MTPPEASKGHTGRLSRLWRRFRGLDRETRAQQSGFSEAVLSRFLAYSEGSAGQVAATAALEVCAGLWSRAFASAKVEGTGAAEAVTPSTLALVGRDVIRRGESLHEIRVTGGRVRLIPSGSWDVHGPEDPEAWVYQSTTFGPSTSRTRWLPASAVVHVVYGHEAARPDVGIGPMEWGKLTGDLTGNLELRLGEEAGGPVGHIIPTPVDGGDRSVEDMREDLAGAKGRTLLAETTAAGWGDGMSAAPRADWQARRFGAHPPDVLPVLRHDAALAVAGACGVPAPLVSERGDGTAQREAWRRFLFGSVLPVARVVEAELSAKLDTPVGLDFTELHASDLAGRARAFQSMVGAGMELDRAAALAGLMGE